MRVIGIDPGENTGIGICDDGVLVSLVTTNFWGAINIIAENRDAFFIVEKPKTKHVWHKGAKARGAIERTAMNVGSVLEKASLMVDYLQRNGYRYKVSAPFGKVGVETFRLITKWEGKSNQHTRDAGMMAFLNYRG